eukprot:3272919-Rhodomonas_salina.1
MAKMPWISVAIPTWSRQREEARHPRSSRNSAPSTPNSHNMNSRASTNHSEEPPLRDLERSEEAERQPEQDRRRTNLLSASDVVLREDFPQRSYHSVSYQSLEAFSAISVPGNVYDTKPVSVLAEV